MEKKRDGYGVMKEGGYIPFSPAFFLVNRVRYNSVGLVFQLGNVLWVFFEFD